MRREHDERGPVRRWPTLTGIDGELSVYFFGGCDVRNDEKLLVPDENKTNHRQRRKGKKKGSRGNGVTRHDDE